MCVVCLMSGVVCVICYVGYECLYVCVLHKFVSVAVCIYACVSHVSLALG